MRKIKYIIASCIVFCFILFTKTLNAASIEGTTFFENIGRYSIAVAGTNNADRGTVPGTGYKLILNYPANWDNIKNTIPDNIKSRITNMAGSYLDYDGNIVASYITPFLVGSYTGDVLVIRPNGEYEVIYGKTTQTYHIDINEPGWYYVSILDAPVVPHHAWAITTIYENENLPMKYIKIVNNSKSIQNGLSLEVDYNTGLKLKSEFEIFGLFIGAGVGAWPAPGQTEDTFEVLLSDGTYQFLHEDVYNGKKIFEGRTTTEFTNDIFNTIRSHNIQGGELDIFHEKIGKDYFNNKEIIGYRITKIGTNGLSPQLIGLAQEIYYPEMAIQTEITDNTPGTIYQNDNIHVKVETTNVTIQGEDNIAYNSTIVSSVDEALSNVRNIVVKVDGIASSMQANYDSSKNVVILSDINTILPGQVITIEYDAIVNSNISKKGNVNSNIEIPTKASIKSYLIDIKSLSVANQEKYKNIYRTVDNSAKINGIYKAVSSGVEIKYINQATGKEIVSSDVLNGDVGENYTVNSKGIEGYEFVGSTNTIEGTFEEAKTIITFEYRKVSNIVTKYVDLDGKEIANSNSIKLKQGEEYTTTAKEFENYEVVTTPENANGIVGDKDIEVVYIYSLVKGKITITKVDRNDETKYLSGATFKVEKLTEENVIDTTFTSIEKATGENGIVEFTDLPVGKYRITETKAPEGYELAKNIIDVEVTKENRNIEIKATDKLKLILPETGGKGIILFIIIGSIFMSLVLILKNNKILKVKK